MNNNSLKNASTTQTISCISAGSSRCSLEFSSLLKEHFNITKNFTAFFEKKKCLVKDCSFRVNNEKSSVTILISFLVIKRRKKQNNIVSFLEFPEKSAHLLTIQKIFRILKQFGYLSSKRLIFRNLNKIVLNYQKSFFLRQHFQITKVLNRFKLESYCQVGIFIFCILHTMKRGTLIFAKFIARFLKIVHRSKRKRVKFERFLSAFIENIFIKNTIVKNHNIGGLKVQIKGRFERDKRTKKLILQKGSIPLQTITSPVNYSFVPSYTSFGVFGIKVWVLD
jgi:hypothetical protein